MGLETSRLKENELCRAARQGDKEAVEELVRRYTKLVNACVRPYFLADAESEDLVQEGMFGLWRAVITFDETRGVPFTAYARTCIERRVVSAVRAGATHRRGPIRLLQPLDQPLLEDHAESHQRTVSDPEALVIGMEERAERLQRLRELLSAFEREVLRLYLDGLTYDEIAAQAYRSRKAVDNALQRIRRKSVLVKF